jgi:hypothetical protein
VIYVRDHDACRCGHARMDHAAGLKGTDIASHCRSFFTSSGRRYPCQCNEFKVDRERLRSPQATDTKEK